MSRVICIAGGKGGVGKSNLAVHLSIAFAELGYTTCMLDTAQGLKSLRFPLMEQQNRLQPNSHTPLQMAQQLTQKQYGCDFLRVSDLLPTILELPAENKNTFAASMSQQEYDFILIDTHAAICATLLALIFAADELFLVLTPNPSSLSDAFNLLRKMQQCGPQQRPKVLVNQCKSESVGAEIFERFRSTTEKFLGLAVESAGVILQDHRIPQATLQQEAFLPTYPESAAARCIRLLACQMASQQMDSSQMESIKHALLPFWQKLFKEHTRIATTQVALERAVAAPGLSSKVASQNEKGASSPSTKVPLRATPTQPGGFDVDRLKLVSQYQQSIQVIHAELTEMQQGLAKFDDRMRDEFADLVDRSTQLAIPLGSVNGISDHDLHQLIKQILIGSVTKKEEEYGLRVESSQVVVERNSALGLRSGHYHQLCIANADLRWLSQLFPKGYQANLCRTFLSAPEKNHSFLYHTPNHESCIRIGRSPQRTLQMDIFLSDPSQESREEQNSAPAPLHTPPPDPAEKRMPNRLQMVEGPFSIQ